MPETMTEGYQAHMGRDTKEYELSDVLLMVLRHRELSGTIRSTKDEQSRMRRPRMRKRYAASQETLVRHAICQSHSLSGL